MRASLPIFAVLALAACAPESGDPPAGGTRDGSEAAAPSGFQVEIVSPADGDTVDGPTLTVTLNVTGGRIVPAGDTTSGTGHHHLYLDADLTPASQPVPSIPGSVVHMGDGSSTYSFTEVEPGEHRVIAVVADGVHVPLQPWVVDTVHVVVR
ncbi:MAG: DUF4399 domain-containing protein [Gemmatimonadales bacterium]|jgi:hypothetical protein|nr:MAG: DUF4399 domain-containing protein [Gemmatimonadales bacterium]